VILGHQSEPDCNTESIRVSAASNLYLSKPGAVACGLPSRERKNLGNTGEETLTWAEDQLQFIPIPTPRWPDEIPTTLKLILFTDKLFGTHVCGEQVFDEGWKLLDEDRRYYYDCLHAAQSRQVEIALNKCALSQSNSMLLVTAR